MKKLMYDAVSYVLKNGNQYHKSKMLMTLGGKREDYQKLVVELKSMQNLDGGWPWQLEMGKPSGVSQTARIIELLLRAGEDKNSDTVKRAVGFLLQRQNSDGGWSENHELEGIIPREHNWISTRYSGFQTADVINALAEAGYKNDARVLKAIDFLRGAQNEEGGWPSYVGPEYPYEGSDIATTDHMVEAFLKLGEPKDSKVVRNAVKALLKHRKDWDSPINAATALNVFLILDYPLEHEYVKELVKNLVESQKPDGGWNWFGDLPTNPGQTVDCIEQLAKCGVQITP